MSREPDPALRAAWRQAQSEFAALLEAVGATETTITHVVRLNPKKVLSFNEFARWISSTTEGEGVWARLLTENDEGNLLGHAMPVKRGHPTAAMMFPWVEIHTLLAAWWITTSWRSMQLARAASELANRGEVIAAAACVRPLVETAAAFWVDSQKMATIWARVKTSGPPTIERGLLVERAEMMTILNEIFWGAKFNERAPVLKQIWGQLNRTNVIGQIERLARACGGDLESDYQWLCNTVHPSIGNTLVFGGPIVQHRNNMMGLAMVRYRRSAEFARDEPRDSSTIEDATASAASRSLAVLTSTADAALRLVDDVGLTTGAPGIARDAYWRNLSPSSRNALCPCHSGLKVKQCSHSWGAQPPVIPTSFR
jgi:hypothetical protein